jgi:hypothetical protein
VSVRFAVSLCALSLLQSVLCVCWALALGAVQWLKSNSADWCLPSSSNSAFTQFLWDLTAVCTFKPIQDPFLTSNIRRRRLHIHKSQPPPWRCACAGRCCLCWLRCVRVARSGLGGPRPDGRSRRLCLCAASCHCHDFVCVGVWRCVVTTPTPSRLGISPALVRVASCISPLRVFADEAANVECRGCHGVTHVFVSFCCVCVRVCPLF